jgi:hypothetical protein
MWNAGRPTFIALCKLRMTAAIGDQILDDLRSLVMNSERALKFEPKVF